MVAPRRRGAAPAAEEVLRRHRGQQQDELQQRGGAQRGHDGDRWVWRVRKSQPERDRAAMSAEETGARLHTFTPELKVQGKGEGKEKLTKLNKNPSSLAVNQDARLYLSDVTSQARLVPLKPEARDPLSLLFYLHKRRGFCCHPRYLHARLRSNRFRVQSPPPTEELRGPVPGGHVRFGSQRPPAERCFFTAGPGRA